MRFKSCSLNHLRNKEARIFVKNTKLNTRFIFNKKEIDIHVYLGNGVSFDLYMFNTYMFYFEFEVGFYFGTVGFQIYDTEVIK